MSTAPMQLPNDTYTEARREWRDRYADLGQGKRNWQFAALAFFLLAVLAMIISIIQVRQVKRLPYLVQMDPAGAVITVVPQLTPLSTTIPLTRIEVATVAEFIRDSRSAINDFEGENAMLDWVNAHASGQAAKVIHNYFGQDEHNPHIIARKHSIAVSITSIVPLGQHTWQVRFTEQYFDRNGIKVTNMEDGHFVAILHTTIAANPGQDLRNPAGIFVTILQWSQELSSQSEAQ
jgi:type IV secretion system protein TrbF